MKPQNRKLRLHKSTLRELTSDLAQEVRAGHDASINTLVTCFTCKTCHIGTGCGPTGNTCGASCDVSCDVTACCL